MRYGNPAVAGHAVCPRRTLSARPAVWFYGATLSAMHFVRILETPSEVKRE